MEPGATEHAPVLLGEALEALAPHAAGSYLDATLGRGGHTAAILQQLGEAGRVLAVDRDPDAVRAGQRRFAGDERVSIVRGNFAELEQIAAQAGFSAGFDGVLLDVGVSSPQLDDPARGFSFMRDGPLDMRMDPDAGRSAADWLATVSERDLARVLFEYGEERHGRRIARAVVTAREVTPIRSTGQLAELIAGAVPGREPGKHPATRSFQAIRICINDELAALDAALEASLALLKPGGRLCVISFHSLEDRRVKRFIRRHAEVAEPWRGLPDIPAHARPVLRPVGKAVRAGAAEIEANPRARSAVLRAAERLAA
ncbi:16S rRNA (cytosine(1402)-N(4))-methyltransferase RsmH [Wenzhouxiangella sp. XN24]|uniref:16S rRNA (cytosine(1402)-N(4))-methyltransferase RsmH n=1 Tax=Wenzhouxiangella sp. XN24 TaxID=2713569 RepID=UPI0013EBE53B|nr:16S rRNA (cytosine(1402)-N(4))-methyltransferase RsmH [Wenzhouxiangella sp. XN24]